MTHVQALKEAAIEAGAILMEGFNAPESISFSKKQDGSFVSNYDLLSEARLLARLRNLLPEIPVISEEDTEEATISPPVFCTIDPLDGTKNYLEGKKSFGVLLAVVENGDVTLGIAYLPAHDILITASAISPLTITNSMLEPLTLPYKEKKAGEISVAIHSRPAHEYASEHAMRYAEQACLKNIREQNFSLLADTNTDELIRLAQVALGRLDLYIVHESLARIWDIAPFKIILEKAGGVLIHGEAFTRPYILQTTFIATANPALRDLLLSP